ncbi:putative homeobox-leucine zipper protein HDG8-like [Capsicum annuum]|nr:putative homeobox-leucine zipper protein HDG8-like [Capsicum annuum]
MVVRSLDANQDPFRPQENDENLFGDETPYLNKIRALMYLANNTRPDIYFVWYFLTSGNNVTELSRVATGAFPGNSITIFQPYVPTESNMLIIQESSIDEMGGFIIYAPIDLLTFTSVINGGDATKVSILPSGITISPDGQLASTSRSTGNAQDGSILTVAFKILISGDNYPMSQQKHMEVVIIWVYGRKVPTIGSGNHPVKRQCRSRCIAMVRTTIWFKAPLLRVNVVPVSPTIPPPHQTIDEHDSFEDESLYAHLMGLEDHSIELEDSIFSEEAEKICAFISDRHKSIANIIARANNHDHHGYCKRNVVKNLWVNHQCGEHLYLFYNTAKAYSLKRFSDYFEEFNKYCPEAAFSLSMSLVLRNGVGHISLATGLM